MGAHTTAPRFAVATAALVALAVAGCTVGPDFKPPAAPTVTGYVKKLPTETASTRIAGGAAQHFLKGRDIPGQWWTLFRSPALDALVKEALRANPSLPAARAALRQAEETTLAARGAFLPAVDFSGSAQRSKASAALGPDPAVTESLYYGLLTPQVTVSYVPDVFGGTRRAVESLAAQAEAQRFELEAAYLSLTSNVVAAAIEEASLRGQIAATQDIIKISTEQLGILGKQYALGQIAEADVAAQEAALAQAQASLPPLRSRLAQQRDLITALIGHLPDAQPVQTFELSSLTLPVDLPVSLPSKLVEQRPDVRAAAAELHVASAQIGVAIAAMLPQITLSGDVGTTAVTLARLGAPENVFWDIIGSVAQPLFHGFSLVHSKRAAEAAFHQAAAQYRSTVIAAFQNVADTLHVLQSDAETLKAAVRAERAARRSLDIAKRQLALGAINYIEFLNAENTYQQARISRVTAQAARFADTAALFTALGGGWWHRDDVSPPEIKTAAKTATR